MLWTGTSHSAVAVPMNETKGRCWTNTRFVVGFQLLRISGTKFHCGCESLTSACYGRCLYVFCVTVPAMHRPHPLLWTFPVVKVWFHQSTFNQLSAANVSVLPFWWPRQRNSDVFRAAAFASKYDLYLCVYHVICNFYHEFVPFSWTL